VSFPKNAPDASAWKHNCRFETVFRLRSWS
jgi:hypothetical protein